MMAVSNRKMIPTTSSSSSSSSRHFVGGFVAIVSILLLLLASMTDPVHGFILPSPFSSSSSTSTKTSLGPMARNGLQYEDIEIGTGRRILPGDAVLCYYVGTYQPKNGRSGSTNNNGLWSPKKSSSTAAVVTFDETEPGEPAEFVVGKGQVIPGWELGILGDLSLEIPPMKIGGDRKLVVPAALAYGDRSVGPIPPNQDLEFQIMILNAQPTGGVSTETQLKGIAGLIGFLSFFAVLGLFIAQHYNDWF
ncbi:peptidyl-prolyl cis-trans isomerase [Nitzschia inconspicua]|uniref:peptidylprolyl isomerase n=1 Tax=Nitzschia inconspicua TaxID=303405 RepID=A0A9K3K6A9_9STRA|nr:peptidyl-prolyl cis-trans isomerase [Nitzschia inconspicua]KAG7339977.1 peptidyl-prolyl cis-trans isomerase [Nitzschia inconspicua]